MTITRTCGRGCGDRSQRQPSRPPPRVVLTGGTYLLLDAEPRSAIAGDVDQVRACVGGTRKLNRARHPKVDHLRRQPGSIRARDEVGVERGGLGRDPPVAPCQQMSISEVARVFGCSRNTVRAALASDALPKYQREPAGSIVDAVEPGIRELLRAYPRMLATVIAERIGWSSRSIRVLSARVAQLRPAYLPPDPASRISYAPGEIAQCDLWFPPITLPSGLARRAVRRSCRC